MIWDWQLDHARGLILLDVTRDKMNRRRSSSSDNRRKKCAEAINFLRKNPIGTGADLVSLYLRNGYRNLAANKRLFEQLSDTRGLGAVAAVALLRRDRKSASWLFARGADLSSAVDMAMNALKAAQYADHQGRPYGYFWFGTGRFYLRYPVWLLDDVAALDVVEGQVEFWRDIAVFDERVTIRKRALGRIEALGDRQDLEQAQVEREKIAKETSMFEKTCAARTKEFQRRIRKLFSALEKDFIFGVDAPNVSGWGPDDGALDIVYREFEGLSDKQQQFFNQRSLYLPRWCSVDTGSAINELVEWVGRHPVVTGACEAVTCYYRGNDEADTELVAESVERHAPTVGLKVDRNDVSSDFPSIRLELAASR